MRLQPIKSRWLTWSKTWFAHLSSYTLYYFFRLTNQGRHQGWNGAGYSPARCSYLSFDLWLPTKRLMIALNSTTQGIALFPESISGNSATRYYISDKYSIITERRYIKICNNTYFFNEEHFSPNFISVRRTVPEIFSGNSAIPWVAPFPATYVHIFCILNNYSSGINVPYFWRAKISSDCLSIND